MRKEDFVLLFFLINIAIASILALRFNWLYLKIRKYILSNCPERVHEFGVHSMRYKQGYNGFRFAAAIKKEDSADSQELSDLKAKARNAWRWTIRIAVLPFAIFLLLVFILSAVRKYF